MKRALVLILLALCTLVPARADNTTGSGASACQFYPMLGVGNGDNTCLDGVTTYYQQTTPSGHCTSTGQLASPGYMANLSLADDPNFNAKVFGLYSSASGSYKPGVCSMALGTGTITSGTALATACGDASAHNSATAVQLGQGYLMVPYCGEAPSGGLNCFTSTGGSGGTSAKCEDFVVGNTIGGGVSNQDLTAAGSHHFLPMPGISEATNSRFGPQILVAGQAQLGDASLNYSAGSQAYFSANSTTTAGQFTVDTACSQNGAITQFNPVTTAISSACNGAQEWSTIANTNVINWSNIATSVSGQNITMSFPAVGSFTGATCTLTESGTTTTDATAASNGIKNGTLTGTNCGNTGTVYTSHVIQNNSSGGFNGASCCTAGQSWTLELKTGDPHALTAPSATTFGTGSGTYGNTQARGGKFGLFQWGGNRPLVDRFGTPHWFEIFDQEFPNNYLAGPAPQAAGGIGENFAVFCATGFPASGVWTWGDATCGADGYSFTMSPALLANNLTLQLGSGGGGSCTTSACTEYNGLTTTFTAYPLVRPCTCTPPATMNAFIYDYGQSGVPSSSSGAPIQSGKDITLDDNGNLMIVYACYDTSGHVQVCYADVNTTNGNTTAQGFVESGNTASNQILTISVTTSPAGTIIADVSTGNCGIYAGCTASSGVTAIIRYKSSNNGSTWSKSIVKQYNGGTNTAAASSACNIYDTIDGNHIFQLCTQPGSYTAGSAVFDFFDEYTGNQ